MPTPRYSTTNRAPIQVPRWGWEKTAQFFAREFKIGQHVAAEGPNGSGKSILMLSLLMEVGERKMSDGRPLRVTVMAASPRDKTSMRPRTSKRNPRTAWGSAPLSISTGASHGSSACRCGRVHNAR